MIFSQNEIMLMIGVVSVLLICITILTVIDIKEYLKAKTGLVREGVTLENVEEVEEEKQEPVEVMEVEETPNNIVKEDKEENYFEEMEDEKYEVKPEINPIVEEDEEVYIPKVEVKEAKVEIPTMEIKEAKVEVPAAEIEEKKTIDAFEELEEIENNLPNNKDDITNFEAEQERTAIISLDELLERSNELYNDNEVVQYDDGNEPISIDEVIKMFKRDDEKQDVQVEEVKEMPKVYNEVVEEKVPYSKKESIPFISSVYGIEKDNNALEFENTATYEKLDRQNYNNFVEKLREMEENK